MDKVRIKEIAAEAFTESILKDHNKRIFLLENEISSLRKELKEFKNERVK